MNCVTHDDIRFDHHGVIYKRWQNIVELCSLSYLATLDEASLWNSWHATISLEPGLPRLLANTPRRLIEDTREVKALSN